MLFRRNWLNTSFIAPLTVTFPGFVGCLNCLWSPLVVSRNHPSFSNSSMISLTLYLFMASYLFPHNTYNYVIGNAKVIKIYYMAKKRLFFNAI